MRRGGVCEVEHEVEGALPAGSRRRPVYLKREVVDARKPLGDFCHRVTCDSRDLLQIPISISRIHRPALRAVVVRFVVQYQRHSLLLLLVAHHPGFHEHGQEHGVDSRKHAAQLRRVQHARQRAFLPYDALPWLAAGPAGPAGATHDAGWSGPLFLHHVSVTVVRRQLRCGHGHRLSSHYFGPPGWHTERGLAILSQNGGQCVRIFAKERPGNGQ
mmetsp:Transcript_61699/g.149388  ORF Transcript_61699/g.149388 Transcript_61699/m.149388 type:complete len:215 (+) Transcript_61699:209-853(+)